ncbi:MAG TPA: hypothetical protein VE396_13420 [Xanthobacteraceae bacterium]|jgi:ribonuclease HIII|nr:hypothetical protein [Xanthobacteraceae bacterium]
MSPDEMQTLLQAHNIGFTAKDMPHGRQFRLADGAIANIYASGKIVWQGKDSPNAAKVRGLCGSAEVASASATSSAEVVTRRTKSLLSMGTTQMPANNLSYFCAE